MLMGLPTLVPLLVRERHNVVVPFTIVSTIVKNNGRDNANNGTNVATFLKEVFQRRCG